MKKVLLLVYTALTLILFSCAKESAKDGIKINNHLIISIQQQDGKEQSEIHFDKDVLTKKEIQYFTKYSYGTTFEPKRRTINLRYRRLGSGNLPD